MTHPQIIDAKGGPIAFAEALQVKPARVRMWKLRGRFPRTVWPEILLAYPDISVDDLRLAEAA